jgi:hypothetical protein
VGQYNFFTQRRKDRKDAKAHVKHLTRLCVFAIFAPLREHFLEGEGEHEAIISAR